MKSRIKNYWFILDKDGRTPIEVNDIIVWADWYILNDKKRIVKQDTLPDGTFISTVFLATNRSIHVEGKPMLFETLVMGGDHNGEGDYYSTWEEAEAGHEEIIHMLFKA